LSEYITGRGQGQHQGGISEESLQPEASSTGFQKVPVGVLIPDRINHKARMMLESFAASSGAVKFSRYKPCDTLILYGWGGEEQQRSVKLHDGRFACFDLGYWMRDGVHNKHWRVSIDGWHSPDMVMCGKH